LLGAVTDTAIDSAVRSGFDAFRLSVRDWEEATRKWRCSLSGAEARRLGASRDWRCGNIRFEINVIAFNRFDPKLATKLNAIPTRFKLEPEEVDLLVRLGHDAVASQTTLRFFRTTSPGVRRKSDSAILVVKATENRPRNYGTKALSMVR
jgi:NTE family protein